MPIDLEKARAATRAARDAGVGVHVDSVFDLLGEIETLRRDRTIAVEVCAEAEWSIRGEHVDNCPICGGASLLGHAGGCAFLRRRQLTPDRLK